MEISIKILKQLASASTLVLPAPFNCPGCTFPCWDGVCRSCIQSIRRNSAILESPTESIEGICPILYSFQHTHTLLKYWKDHQGTLLHGLLFHMSPDLKAAMVRQQFDFIVPIPQTFRRSWRRGHESARTVAKVFAKELGLPIVDLLKLRDENTPRQASLTQWQRELAPTPFEISIDEWKSIQTQRPDLKILLVDDLITSGNTMIRAAEEMKSCLPRLKIWAGSLGYRPKRSQKYH